MTNKIWIGFSVAGLALCSAALLAQQNPPATSAIPPEGGIYYQAPAGWVPLRSTLMMGLTGGSAKEFFSVGRREEVVEMPGRNSGFRINNARPTFVVRGLSPATGLYLVRGTQKQDFREVRMPLSSRITQGTHFRAKDLNDIEMEPLFPDVLRVRPRADLKPGEYVIVSDLEPRYRAIRLGFEFGVFSGN